jgi:hypothetical protein
VVLGLIRQLPEGSRFVAHWTTNNPGVAEAAKLTAAEERYLDSKLWSHSDRLTAMIVNAVNQNTIALGNWAKGKTPEIPIVGPADWDPKRKRRIEIREQIEQGAVSTADILKAMGWNGQDNRPGGHQGSPGS